MIPIILCGGSGQRLWPLSRQAFPKQFISLIDGKSLLQLTLERMKLLSQSVVCLSNNDHRFLVQEAMELAGVDGEQILEPVGRNTAPAMTAAALNANPDDLLLFCSADHYIPDQIDFANTISKGIPAALQGYVVTYGINPTSPKPAYGYIEQSIELPYPSTFQVARFVEKPSAEAAAELLLKGGYSWNAGIFLVQASTLLSALELHAPDILRSIRQAVTHQVQEGLFKRLSADPFIACRSESIDYAVLEKYEKVAVVSFNGIWSDMGSWEAVAELTIADSSGNRVHGAGFAYQSTNTFIHAPHRTVVGLGTQNLFIIDTPDALLVAACSHTEQVKQVVADLEKNAVTQALQHRRVARPWGSYDSVDRGDNFQVKRITVKPGGCLSLQVHRHRAEHWIVVRGTAQVTCGHESLLLKENQSTYIPAGTLHRLENLSDDLLEIIEVQTGSYLGEDDIERFEDKYGR